VDCVGIEPTT